jgi:adenylate cyclase
MLKEYFADLANPVIDYSGEIYQYAGDEMIISWKLKTGLQNNDCIACFFAMKNALAQQTAKYEACFGLLPGFKAGLHYGMVTTGEIGVLKKEIIFTGDVLNTAARIQGLCNQFGADILISGPLAKVLGPSPLFKTKSFGLHNLKGRDEQMEIHTVVNTL